MVAPAGGVEVADAGPVAAVDCGTNSTRILIADEAGRCLLRQLRITRLGEGVDRSGVLRPEAIERTLAALRCYRQEMDNLGVVGGRQVATSAVRDAANGAQFLAAASAATGLATELLSGADEARLSFWGATLGMDPPAAGEDLVVDIGGGSTELAVGDPRRPAEVDGVSVDVGCVRVTERYLRSDPPQAAQLERARAAIDRALEEAAGVLPRLGHLGQGSRLLGLAGTVTTLAALEQQLSTYDPRKIHHFDLSLRSVERWCAVLAAENAQARARRPGMSQGREDVIVGGVLILATVMTKFGFPRCLVSESDILDGMVASVLGGRHHLARPRDEGLGHQTV